MELYILEFNDINTTLITPCMPNHARNRICNNKTNKIIISC